MNSYFRGIDIDFTNLDQFVGIIGSRKPTTSERNAAFSLGKKTVEKGKIVVSGLAIGIDIAAHLGAINNFGNTLAIVNTTINQLLYPKEHRVYQEQILNQGGFLHPFLDENTNHNNQKQFNQRLIERNIVLAYLCPTIIVVKDDDSPITGGTKWATKYGMSMGKDVYRFDSNGKFHKNPEIASDEKTEPWWAQECNYQNLLHNLLNVS